MKTNADQTILQFTEAASGTTEKRLIAQNFDSGNVKIETFDNLPAEVQAAFLLLENYSNTILNS